MELKKDKNGKQYLEVKVEDWQVAHGNKQAEGKPENIALKIEFDKEGVVITAANDDPAAGRRIWVELENGNLRVHSYNKEKDSPLNVTIPEAGEIEIDDHDYRLEGGMRP